MPWENIGSVNTGQVPQDGEWIEFCERLAIRYLLFVCGDPPAYTTLDIMTHDHELGSYTSIGLWYEFEEPREYFHKCEDALDVLNDSIAWEDLKEHYENSLAEDDDDGDDDSEYFDDYENAEHEESALQDSNDAGVDMDSIPSPGSRSDDFPIDDFAQVGAMLLIEAIAAEDEYLPEDFYAQMKAEWGEVIDPHWDGIFTQSLKVRNEWLNRLRRKRRGDSVIHEYSWELTDDEVVEISGEEAGDDEEIEDIQNQLREVQISLAEIEDRRREAAQELRDSQQKIARALEQIANGDRLEKVVLGESSQASPAIHSDIDELGFYSQVYRTVESKMPNMASAEQVRAILSPENGILKEELEWLDIDSFLYENPHPSRDQVLDYIRGHNLKLEEVQLGTPENPRAHFQDKAFHLPGGENYREFVLTMPEQIEPYEPDQIHFTTEGGGTAIVWARFDERDSGSTLHVAEIQSKRHQDGRGRGYRNKDETDAPLSADVPYAPYKNSNAWSMLMFKRILRYAVENSYERITWDTGETQAERYGLDEAGRRGMKAFYDEQLVNSVNKLVRRWDSQVVKANSLNGWTIDAGIKGQIPVHSVSITNEMRGIVMDEGISLFSVLSLDERI